MLNDAVGWDAALDWQVVLVSQGKHEIGFTDTVTGETEHERASRNTGCYHPVHL